MKTKGRSRGRCLAPILLLIAAAPVWATTYTWVNTSGGNWSTPGNWSPAQVPKAADTALITTAGTYIVNLDETANVSSLTVGGATGLQTLQVNANSLTATNATVNGLLTVTNGTLYGAFTLNSGGVLNESGLSLQSTGSLTVENGGVVNMASRFSALGPLTNAGTLNLSNASIALYNGNGSSYTGGIVNQGTINISGANGNQITANEGPQGGEYLFNEGSINLKSGAGATEISVTYGVLMGTYNAAAGTTLIFDGGWVNAPVTAGTPPVLNGPGQYQFGSGYLLLNNETIPNLTLTSGTLELGTMFDQDGAITNLTLDGISLAGTNSVTGTLTLTNSPVAGALTVKSGGVLNETGLSLQSTGSLTVENGGVVNMASRFSALGPLTNAGTLNLSNASIALYNGNGSSYTGGIVNQGTINISGANGNQITANEGPQGGEYLFNEGSINLKSGAGATEISVTYGVLMGTYNAAAGTTLIFDGGWVNAPVTAGTPPVLNGPGQYQFGSGYLLLNNETIPNLTLTSGTLELGTMFDQDGAITNLTLDGISLAGTNSVTGTLTLTNSPVAGALTVKSGGVLNETGLSLQSTGSLTVENGGVVNMASRFSALGPLTNAGTLNLSNASIALYNGNGSSYTGGIVNQGTINISGANGNQITANEGPQGGEYLFNEGSINLKSGAGATEISVTYGVLMGTYNAAAGTTLIFDGGWVNAPVTAGTPPVLNGPGQYQFGSGYLLLNNETIPNLTLTSGTLELGTMFDQDGAITNLTLDGISLAGTNSVTGTLTLTNSPVAGALTVKSGGVLNESGLSLQSTGSLTVENGGVVNMASRFSALGPLTNAGTLNLSNASIALYNGNGSSYTGGIINQGTINLYGANGNQITANEGPQGGEYVINQGTISQRPGTGTSEIQAPIVTDSGTLDSQEGTLIVTGLTLESSGTLNFGINSTTDYGHINLPTNAALTGIVSANFNGGFTPTNGEEFSVLQYESFSGLFLATNVPAGYSAQGVYGSTVFGLQISGSGTGPTNRPILAIERANATTVDVSWPTAAGNFNLQTSPNLAPGSWSNITSGIITEGTNYVLPQTVGVEPAFFRLQSP